MLVSSGPADVGTIAVAIYATASSKLRVRLVSA
jgi:hypothetical protein